MRVTDRRTFIIVGAGLTGTRAARTLRSEGFTGRVILLGAEDVRPYDRVTLSKHFLYREPGFHGLFLHDADFYSAHDIDLRLHTEAVGLDPATKTVTVAGGDSIPYDAVLLATGAEPRRWKGPGGRLKGVHYLRTLHDAQSLQAALDAAVARSGRVVVIGAGWIGCEVAAAARRFGLDVTLVGRGALPLQRQLGPEMAAFFRDVHTRHGVTWRGGCDVSALRGSTHVEHVSLSDGTELPADVVVFGIGATPRTRLAADAGARIGDGIRTDDRFGTDLPHVFAAGDAADVFNRALGRHIRLQHFSAALRQGPAAARAMLGTGAPYNAVPFFFTDQYDVWMEYTGDAAAADRLVMRTLPDADAFIAFWLRDGRLVAGMNVNIKGVPDAIRDLIASEARPDIEALADPDVPLEVAALAG